MEVTSGFTESQSTFERQVFWDGAPDPIERTGYASELYRNDYRRDERQKASMGLYPAWLGRANITNPYFRIIMSGQNPSPSWNFQHDERVSGSIFIRNYGRGASIIPIWDVVGQPDESVLRDSYETALIALLNKYQSEVSMFKGGIFLGELRETLRMIKRPAQALRRRVGHYWRIQQRIRRAPTKPSQDTLANTYLEYMFGAAPLMGDISDAGHALARLYENNYVSRLRTSESYSDYSAVRTVASQNPLSNGYNDSDWSISVKRSGGVRFCGDFQVQLAGNRLRQFGISASEFVPTVWELLPWSFLVDYFSNIGNVLAASTSEYPSSIWHSATYFLEEQYTATLVRKDPNTLWSASKVQGQKVVYMRRLNPRLELGLADLRLTIPGFDSDPWKWLNIAALMKARSGSWSPSIPPTVGPGYTQ